MNRLLAPSLLCLASLLPWPALAGPIADAGAEIEAQLDAGDPYAALDAAGTVFGMVWDQIPSIGFTDFALVAEPAQGYGIYTPREGNVYAAGEPILIYAEPFGFGYGQTADGLHAIGLAIDLKVMTEGGEVVGEIADVSALDLVSRYQNREFQANITYTLDGLAPGTYVLQTILRDRNSDKVGAFDLPIEIAP